MVKETVVLDLGSALLKCGFAGESAPRHILPSPIDAWQQEAVKKNWKKGEWVQVLGPLLVKLFIHHLCVRPKDRKVLACEALAGPTAFREAVADVLFVWLKVPAVLMVPSLTTVLYTAGAEGGLVVDVGLRECHVLAVAFGRPLLHTYTVAGVGSLGVVERVRELLMMGKERKEEMTLEMAQDILVQACFVPSRQTTTTTTTTSTSSLTYKPKTTDITQQPISIEVTPEARSTVAEGLFAAEEQEGGNSLPIAILESLRKCPRDLRRLLAGHVLVVGGGAMLPGFCCRLAEEVKEQARTQARYQELCPVVVGGGGGGGESLGSAASSSSLCIVRDAALLGPRNVLGWMGGSILATLEETVAEEDSLFVTREEEGKAATGTPRSKGKDGLLPEWLSVGK